MKILKGKRCQCCSAALASDFHLIFDAEGKRKNIAFLLFDYIGKKLNENDNVRYAVCDACYRQLIQCHEFKQKCIRANAAIGDDDDDDDEPSRSDENNSCDEDDANIKPQNASISNPVKEDNFAESTESRKSYIEWDENNIFEIDEPIDEQEKNIDIDGTEENEFDMEEMKVEYLEENDDLDDPEEIDHEQQLFQQKNHQMQEVEKLFESKSLPFDFTTIIVKPIFTQIEHPEDFIKIKQKIKSGIPRHMVELHKQTAAGNNQNFDVQKIVTSDDLINILEDDYQNKSNYAKRTRDDGDVFKIPNIETISGVEYLDDVEHIDIDDYLKSIASITYDEAYEHYINCRLCPEQIISQQHMIYHIHEMHTVSNGVLCIFDESCQIFCDLVAVQEHIFSDHVDLIPTQLCLTCTTCNHSFKSSVQFGKHMCFVIDDGNVDFQCNHCDIKLSSRKRYLFHNQFHLENARPKVCIICELTFQCEEKFYNHVMFSHERIFEHFCDKCDKSFSSKIRLELHVRVHHTKRTILCPSCDKSFVDKNMLDEHISTKHSTRTQGDKQFICSICQKIYNRSSRLKKHMTIHDKPQKNDVLVCEKCSMAFASIEEIEDHINRIHDDAVDPKITKKELLFVVCCEYCENAFVDFKSLAKHKQNHLNDDKPFKCEFCMACYESYAKMKTHKNTHIHQQYKFPVQRHYMCDIESCWKKYRHWSDLLNHRKTVHLINPTIYKCSECEQTFYQSWNFSYHKKTVHCSTELKCDVCDFQCRTLYSLRLHQRNYHSSDAEDSNANFKAKPKKQPIKKQSRVDLDEFVSKTGTSLICNTCGKQFSTRNGARSHVEMVHLKIRNHSCKECGKEYYLRKDYEDHRRMHTAETPYECQHCSKKFRTASLLNEHRKSHTNERPHRCPYCVATFKRAYVLKNHIKQHIGVKGFPCTVSGCTKEYRTQWELNSHRRSKHKNMLTESKTEVGTVEPIERLSSNEETPGIDSTKRQNIKKIHSKIAKKTIYVPGPIFSNKEADESSYAEIIVEEEESVVTNVDHNYLSKRSEATVTESNMKYDFD